MGADYIITGACSPLARHIIARLKPRGVRIVGIDRPEALDTQERDIRLYGADVGEKAALLDIFRAEARAYTVVIHAAEHKTLSDTADPMLAAVNQRGTQNVLAVCTAHPVRRLVYVASGYALAPSGLGFAREPEAYEPGRVCSAYGKSKAAACAAVMQAAQAGLDCVIALPGALAGPGDEAANEPVNRLIRHLAEGRMRFGVCGGIELVDLRDAAQGVLLAADKGVAGRSYILSGRYISMRELFDCVKTAVEGPRCVCIPRAFARLALPLVRTWDGERPLYTACALDTLGMNTHFSHERAERELGFMPRRARDTIAEAARQYRPAPARICLPAAAAQAK